MLRAEKIEPAIRERMWSIPVSASERYWTGALLLSGSASIEDHSETQVLSPVSVFLAPVDRERALRIRAGSEAIIFSCPEQIVLAAIGQGPESPDIRRLLSRPAVSHFDDNGKLALQVERAFDAILVEAGTKAHGQATMIEACLKLVFGTLLRNLPETDLHPHTMDRGSNLLLRFRQLLENRFRDRWTVLEYASEVGISADRLHDLCVGKMGKPPSKLIQDRTLHEAQMLLARSSLSIKEISDRLGFRDPSHFSKYFKTTGNVSPRDFRQNLTLAEQAEETPKLNFSDWP